MASADSVAQVTSALKELIDCPESVKQMLLTGLPNTFGPDMHGYQKEIAGMMRKSFEESRSSASDAHAASLQAVEQARTVLEVHKADVASIQSAEEEAKSHLAEEEASLEANNATVAKEQVLCEETNVAKASAVSEKQKSETAKAEVESVKNGSFQMLLDGGWDDEEVRDMCIEGVCNYLQEQRGDAVLLAALPKALSHPPAQRGPFDKIAVDAALGAISEKVDSLTKQLEVAEEKFWDAEAEYLGAWAILDVAQDQVTAASKKRDSAEAGLQDVSVNKKLATSRVLEQEDSMSTVLSEATLLESKVQRLDLALGALTQLEAGEDQNKENTAVVDKENIVNTPAAETDTKVDAPVLAPLPLAVTA